MSESAEALLRRINKKIERESLVIKWGVAAPREEKRSDGKKRSAPSKLYFTRWVRRYGTTQRAADDKDKISTLPRIEQGKSRGKSQIEETVPSI